MSERIMRELTEKEVLFIDEIIHIAKKRGFMVTGIEPDTCTAWIRNNNANGIPALWSMMVSF